MRGGAFECRYSVSPSVTPRHRVRGLVGDLIGLFTWLGGSPVHGEILGLGWVV
jgi:hypothetical protein